MKTPREILLARHREARPALDSIRKDALETIAGRVGIKGETTTTSLASTLGMFFRELFLPTRRIWIGLAACWALIFVLHLAGGDTVPVVAKASPPPSPELLAALRPQQQLFAELLASDTKQTDADQPRRPRPSPHSEIRSLSLFA